MLKFSSLPEMGVMIESDNPSDISIIFSSFNITYEKKSYNYVFKRWGTKKDTFQFGVLVTESQLIMPRGLAYLVYKRTTAYELDTKLEYLWESESFYSTLDRWKEIFNSHPNLEKGKIQLNASMMCEGQSSGLISLATGVGKGELIVAQADSYVKCHQKKVLIIVYSNSVKAELMLRAASYGVPVSSDFTDLLDVTNSTSIFIMNPVGFMRSKDWKNTTIKNMLKYFNVVIADEAHHASCESWTALLKLISPDHVWGYTATGDKLHGLSIDENMDYRNSSLDLLDVVSNVGLDIVRHSLDVPIELYTDRITTINKKSYNARKKENPAFPAQLVYDFCMHENTAKYIHDTYRGKIKDGICFIPVTTVKSGLSISEYLNSEGLPTLFWSQKVVWSPAGELNSKKFELADLKKLATLKMFKILITTQIGFEGVDIPGLNSIIPLSGSSYKQTLQPLGRAARSDVVKCFIVMDSVNNIYNKQSRKRLKIIKAQKNVIKM